MIPAAPEIFLHCNYATSDLILTLSLDVSTIQLY